MSGFCATPIPPAAFPSHGPSVSWQPAHYGWIATSNHVRGGNDIGGEPLYVGRARHGGDLIPGKVNPHHGPACYVTHSGHEHKYHNFEVLTVRPGTELVWTPTSGGILPPGAVQGGVTAHGEPLYIGRHMQGRSMVIGKVHPSHGCAYVGFDGNEIKCYQYEILCERLHAPHHHVHHHQQHHHGHYNY